MNGAMATAGTLQNRPLAAEAGGTPLPPPRNTTDDNATGGAAEAVEAVAAAGEANTTDKGGISNGTATATKQGPTHLVVLGERRGCKKSL